MSKVGATGAGTAVGQGLRPSGTIGVKILNPDGLVDGEANRKVSFQEEFRRFLRRCEIAFDERYVWD